MQMESNTHIYEFDLFKEVEYKDFKKQLKVNDVLIIKSLCAIGKTQNDIQKELTTLTKKLKVDLVVLDMPLFDTRVNKEINGTLIPDLVIQTLSSSKKIEKSIRKQLQTEGIAQAQASGVKFGRPAEPFPDGFEEVYKKFIDKQLTKSDAARELDLPFHKVSRLIERKNRELIDSMLNN